MGTYPPSMVSQQVILKPFLPSVYVWAALMSPDPYYCMTHCLPPSLCTSESYTKRGNCNWWYVLFFTREDIESRSKHWKLRISHSSYMTPMQFFLYSCDYRWLFPNLQNAKTKLPSTSSADNWRKRTISWWKTPLLM